MSYDKINKYFDELESRKMINKTTKPLIIKDDSQVVTIVAKKIKGDKRHYIVTIKPEK